MWVESFGTSGLDIKGRSQSSQWCKSAETWTLMQHSSNVEKETVTQNDWTYRTPD